MAMHRNSERHCGMTFPFFTIKILSFASICEALGRDEAVRDDISQIRDPYMLATQQMSFYDEIYIL